MDNHLLSRKIRIDLPRFLIGEQLPNPAGYDLPPITKRTVLTSSFGSALMKRQEIQLMRRGVSKSRWKELGWRRDGRYLYGTFNGGSYSKAGRIKLPGDGDSGTNFFMQKPPGSLLDGPHGACYHERKDNWYWIHFNTENDDIDSKIFSIERQLAECDKEVTSERSFSGYFG